MTLDLGGGPLRIHVVGVGGAGMSAIATVLARMGHVVSGSDLKEAPALARLRAAGVHVAIGHDAANVPPGVDAVAISTAVPATNPEVAAAADRGVPVLRRAEVLAAVCATRRTVAVSGTHGKTTTSSMLALVLRDAGLRPSFLVGGELNEIGAGAVWDTGAWLVVEADESDGTFLELGAEAVVVTNVEADHLDHYGSLDEIRGAFGRFLADAPGPRVVCADEPNAAALAASIGAVTYGTSPGATYRIVDVELGRASAFALEHEGRPFARVHLPVPGLHNVRNATAALVTATLLGAALDDAVAALERWGGVARRFQYRGESGGVTYVDDYAHNPGKVRAVLAAARAGGWHRVVCVFQPHRYSRTADLIDEFADAFVDADVLVVTDVYAAGEAPRPGVTGELVARRVREAHPGADVRYLARRDEQVAWLLDELRPGDLCLTLGAGDVTLLADELLGTRR